MDGRSRSRACNHRGVVTGVTSGVAPNTLWHRCSHLLHQCRWGFGASELGQQLGDRLIPALCGVLVAHRRRRCGVSYQRGHEFGDCGAPWSAASTLVTPAARERRSADPKSGRPWRRGCDRSACPCSLVEPDAESLCRIIDPNAIIETVPPGRADSSTPTREVSRMWSLSRRAKVRCRSTSERSRPAPLDSAGAAPKNEAMAGQVPSHAGRCNPVPPRPGDKHARGEACSAGSESAATLSGPRLTVIPPLNGKSIINTTATDTAARNAQAYMR